MLLLLLKTLEKRCQEQMDIQLTVTNAVKDFIAEKGSDNKYGARPLRRAIQSRIEDCTGKRDSGRKDQTRGYGAGETA